MLLSELIVDLKLDTRDDSITFNVAKRGFERAAVRVNKDMGTSYVVAGDDEITATITPDPTQRDKELLLLQAMKWFIQADLVSASNAIMFKSGDKTVDRSRSSLSKENAINLLDAEYREIAGLDDVSTVSAGDYDKGGHDADYSATDYDWVK